MNIDKPLTPEEAKAGDIIPEGIYPFEVVDATDEISSKGNDMIKIKMKLFMPDGRERYITDFLLAAMEFKLAHFFESTGRWEKYQSGSFDASDCWGATGELKVYTQKAKGEYPAKHAVADYILTEAQSVAKVERKVAEINKATTQPAGDPQLNDDVPF